MTLVKRNPSYYWPSVVDQFFGNDYDWSFRNFSKTNTTLPAVNIKEEEDLFLVEVASPGLQKEDFNIEVKDNKLTISSEKKEENVEEKDKYSKKEFSYQSFVRSFTLPRTVNSDAITAKYENGILLIHIPKKDEAKPRPTRLIEIG